MVGCYSTNSFVFFLIDKLVIEFLLHVLFLKLISIEKMQILRSTNMGFLLVIGTNHMMAINTAEFVWYSFRYY